MAESESPKRASEHVWAILGKVGAVIGLLIGGLSLWNMVTTPKGKLVGYVQFAPFSLPPDSGVYEIQVRAAQKTAREELEKLHVKPTGEILKNIMEDPEFLVKEQRKELRAAQRGSKGILYLVIRNQGDSTLKGVRLIVGERFNSATVVRDGKEPETVMSALEKKLAADEITGVEFEPNELLSEIELGDLAPQSKVRVTVFRAFDWGVPEPRLVHESGTGTIHMPSYSFSVVEWLLKAGRRDVESFRFPE